MPSKTELPTVPALLQVAVHSLGGKERSNQLTMASAVAHSIDTGEHLAVQAGTGTGKSLAYLVPSIRHAVESGKTVIVIDQDGKQADKAARQLKTAGFEDIYGLEGGVAAWTAAGLPLIK